ncbi:two pore domain potassium channel family protein [bacterium]|nr:MAG: two pore domain potassium channel family protein [bacterium]
MRWLWNHGQAYGRWVTEERRSTEDRWAYLDKNARVFPFGVSDYRLDRQAGRGHLWAKILVTIHRSDRMALAYIAGTVLFVALGDPPYAKMWVDIGYLFMGTNLLIGLESALAFSQTGSYLAAYHGIGRSGRRTRRTEELGTFSRLVLRALAVSAATGVASNNWLGSIKGADEWYDPIYFVLTTFSTVGYGDLTPANGYGKLLASLTMLQSATILVVVVSSVLSSNTD